MIVAAITARTESRYRIFWVAAGDPNERTAAPAKGRGSSVSRPIRILVGGCADGRLVKVTSRPAPVGGKYQRSKKIHLKGSVQNPGSRRCLRIFDLDPGSRWPRAIKRIL